MYILGVLRNLCNDLVTSWGKGMARAGSEHNYIFYQYDTDTILILWTDIEFIPSRAHFKHQIEQ